ncbi:hypothetical protein [Flavobacterium sp. UMI-01]|uniref:hypothetical protein n=1 Tax=Flavobacterium sp. UMI-01 TaxID=1441053 RepID=UPI001C7CBF33|nr:hypothetical protein [Flavobacterium sp. UMI-01]GIZ08529.1 hypothetical protein FUMI01_12560 [Flavobacterium sp. UMI-01]
MKKLRIITGMALVALLGFTSCQNEIDEVNGDNPNSVNSTTANNIKRTTMYDGSFDDFLDGNSCSSIVLPATATVNGVMITLLTQLDYQQVISILGKFNDDQDTVALQFPLKVKTSNYTEVTVNNQTEYNAIVNACSQATNEGKDAIKCIKFNFPLTLLTYNTTFEQTGSLVITSKQQLYTYMSNANNDELFAIKYPISITFSDNTTISINSDAELQSSINECRATENVMDEAEANAVKLQKIMVDGAFKVQSFISLGVDKANDYKDYTVDFTNDFKIKATNALISTVNGTYAVTTTTDVYLEMNFSGNANFNLFNNKWKVTSMTTSAITLQSTTNAAVTLVLKQI